MDSLGDLIQDSLTLKLMSVEYTEEGGRTIVHVFGRDADGERHHVEISGHYPSFFIEADEHSKRIDNHYAVHHTETHDDSGQRYESLHGDPLVRVYTYLPSQVSDIRDLFSWTGEADVFYTNRWLIDSGVMTGVEIDLSNAEQAEWIRGDHRVHMDDVEPLSRDATPRAQPKRTVIDIEVASDQGFPDADTPEHPVSTIVAWDSYSEEYVGWILESPAWGGNTLAEIHGEFAGDEALLEMVELDSLRSFDDESELLADFHGYMDDQRPDIITGWWSNDFDVPYLIARSKELNTYSYQDWSPLGEAFLTRFEPVVKGVECVDMLEAYKKTLYRMRKSNKLEDVAQDVVGEGKETVDEGHTEMWRESPVEFLKYNKRDVELVHRIDEERGLTDLLDNLRAVTGCSYTDPIGGNIDMMDILFLRKASDQAIALPTASKPEVGDYHGAYVFTPTPGLHEHVVYPDYSSLYPNMMYQCNMSPETLVGTEADLEASEWTADDCVWSYVDTTTPPNLKPDVEADESHMEKLYFLKPSVEEGFVRGVLDDLIDLGNEYRGSMYEAVKRVRNSCFTPDTEVLTPEGVKTITDVSVGDDVYSLNPETEEIEIKEVTETIERPEYDGDVIHIQNEGVDLKVTPDHDMIVNRSRYTDEYEVVEAGSLNEWTHYETPNEWSVDHVDGIDILDLAEHAEDVSEEVVSGGKNHSSVSRWYDADNVVRLLGWVVAEGSFYKGTSDTITISQRTDEHREAIKSLLDDMEISYYENDRAVSIHNTPWFNALTEWCGIGSENKRLPGWVFSDCSGRQKRLLFDTMMDGDGDTRRTYDGAGGRYSTLSEQLRDDFIRLAYETGRSASYSYDSGCWRVHVKDSKQSFRMHRDAERQTAENGVYCVQVEDNHTLVAGRNGKFTHVPNCYGVMGDSESYKRGFRLFDWQLAEAITLGGQRVLKDGADHFVDVVDDPDAYVVGGDTDCVMTAMPSASDGGDALRMAARAAEETNSWLDEFAVEQFGLESADDARMEIEIESYASRIFFKADDDGKSDEGVKKRYAQMIEWNDDEGWLDEPEMGVKGFEYVRSDYSNVTEELQRETFESILTLDEEKAENRVTSMVKAAIEDIMSDREGGTPVYTDLDDLGIPFGIGQPLDQYGSTDRRPQPQYRGAKYANEFIYEAEAIEEGDKPMYFYVDDVYSPQRKTYSAVTAEDGDYVDAVSVHEAADVPDEIVIDRRKMIRKTMFGPLRGIFNTLGWGIEWAENWLERQTPPEYYRDAGQTGVEEFM